MPRPAIGLYLRTGSNIFQWRIRVPKDLSHLYPGKVWAHRVSLGTPSRAEANRLGTTLYAQWKIKFDQQRQQQSAQPVQALTPELIEDLSKTLLHELLDGDHRRRTTGDWTKNGGRLYGMPDSLRAEIVDDNVDEYVLVTEAAKTGSLEYALDALQAVAADKGMLITRDTPGIEDALASTLAAQQQAAWHRIERDKGYQVPTPPAPTCAPSKPKRLHTLRDSFEKWRLADGLKLTPDAVRAREIALGLFEEFTNNTPIANLTREQGNDFKAWLQTRGEASKTVFDRLTYVKAMLKYAHVALGWINSNPWDGFKVRYETETLRSPWSLAQICAFFDQPLYTSYALPQRQKGAGADAGYWIPLIALYSGARSSELCQLYVTDIVQIDGIWAIDINENHAVKTVKTKASRRQVPVHSELIRLGFLEYVEVIRAAGHERLWPALTLREGKPSHTFSKWFNTKPRLANPAAIIPDFHSLRHTVRTTMTAAKISEQVQDKITGHESHGSTGMLVYAREVPMLQRREAVEAIRYEGFNLPRSYAGHALVVDHA